MKTLLGAQDPRQKVLLLPRGHDLVAAAVAAPLVAAKRAAELLDERAQRQPLVGVEVRELLGEDGVVVRVLGRAVQRVQNRLLPGPRDLDDLLVLLDVVQRDGRPPQVEQHQDEHGHVPDSDGEVQEVHELLARRHGEQIVREVEDDLRLRHELRELHLLEDVGVVGIHQRLLAEDALHELVLHAVVVVVELAARVDRVREIRRREQDDVLAVRVLEAGHEAQRLVEEDRRALDGDGVDADDDAARVDGHA
mmetsp:Transcript_23063/g.79329  ORF Transcript_23063/g.79329 Transcript_23063/m.79329 type:complete len:251 (+) Transcript_23063:2328-3080(+)